MSELHSIQQKREELTHKTFTLMFRILIIFGIPAILAYFSGAWLDSTYGIRPYGTLAVLAVAFVSSWYGVLRIYQSLQKQYRELDKQEEIAMAKKQEEMRNNT